MPNGFIVTIYWILLNGASSFSWMQCHGELSISRNDILQCYWRFWSDTLMLRRGRFHFSSQHRMPIRQAARPLTMMPLPLYSLRYHEFGMRAISVLAIEEMKVFSLRFFMLYYVIVITFDAAGLIPLLPRDTLHCNTCFLALHTTFRAY